MVSQAQTAADLQAVTEQLAKIGAETSLTLVKVAELEVALAAAGDSSPEVTEKVEALKAQAKVVDDLVADLPTGEPA